MQNKTPAQARLEVQLRTTHRTRLEGPLRDLASKLGRRPYTTPTAVEKRVAALLRRHPARGFLTVRVGQGDAGPTLAWERDEAQLAAAADLDGRYVLGTNAADAAELDANALRAESKRRAVPEKGYATLKGPLAIRPVYLHKQRRSASSP